MHGILFILSRFFFDFAIFWQKILGIYDVARKHNVSKVIQDLYKRNKIAKLIYVWNLLIR